MTKVAEEAKKTGLQVDKEPTKNIGTANTEAEAEALQKKAEAEVAAKAAAETTYRKNNRPTAYFRDHIAAAETLLQTLWQIHFPDSNDISLIAIGGFGRCELYPHSDWDLAIISSAPFSDGLQQQTAQFIQTLWDARLNPAIKRRQHRRNPPKYTK